MMMSNNNKKKPLEKSRTFQLKKSPSIMELENPPPKIVPKPQRSATFGPSSRKSPMIEFPTSPQLILGQEIRHFSHPHPLAEIDLSDLFTCAGCKEYGSGKRFTCQQCDFQLHDFCAFAPQSLKNHPLHGQHLLLFFAKPVKGGILKSKCDVCGKATKGYTFGCSVCSFQMHPCCAMLSTEINNYPEHRAHNTLKLLAVTPAAVTNNNNGDPSSFVCGECKRKRSGSRVYRCTVCEYHLHAVCAKGMVNGLQANNIKAGPEKPSMLGTAARLASQVVVEFIGGLIEGLGESVGETIVSDLSRGRGRTSTTKRNN